MNLLESIAGAEDDASAWQLVLANREDFVWTQGEALDVAWNRIAGKFGIAERMSIEPCNGHQRYVCGTTRRVIPVVQSRDDSLIIFPHALAQAGAAHLEMRFCRASAQNPEKAFAAAPPEVWAAIDSGPNAKRVSESFMPVAQDLATFAAAMSAPEPAPPWMDRLSPDGRLHLAMNMEEVANSQWVMSPAVVEASTGEFLLLLTYTWSADSWKWTGDAFVEITLRKYPGKHAPASLVAIIDFAQKTARIGAGETFPLSSLEARLDAALTWK